MARRNVIASIAEAAPAIEALAAEAPSLVEDTPPDNVGTTTVVPKWSSTSLRKQASLKAGVSYRRYKAFDGSAAARDAGELAGALESELSEITERATAIRAQIRELKSVDTTQRQARACLLLEARLWREGESITETILSQIAENDGVELDTGDGFINSVNVLLGSYAAFDRTGRDTYRVSDALRAMAARMRAAIDEVK